MKIRTIVLFVSVTVFVLYLAFGIAISVYTIHGAQDEVTAEIGNLVSTSVAEIVSEPLKLGSFVEARLRIQNFIANGLFKCAELNYESMPIVKCELDKMGLKRFEAPLTLSTQPGFSNPTLVTYVDNNKVQSSALRRSLPVIMFIFLFGLIFFLMLIMFMRLVSREIHSVSKEIENDQINFKNSSVISELNLFRQKMHSYVQLKKTEITTQVQMKISMQVAHDIRSPLSAINMALHDQLEIPKEKQKIVGDALARINGIANDLLEKGKSESQDIQIIDNLKSRPQNSAKLDAVVNSIVSEKKLVLSAKTSISIVEDYSESDNAVVSVDPTQLGRIISNIINNSIDAFENETGQISVRVVGYDGSALLVIRDNGKGIPTEILSKLGATEVSFGKVGIGVGNGLAIFHAKKTVASWGGMLQIHSTLGMGTMVEIKIPRVLAKG